MKIVTFLVFVAISMLVFIAEPRKWAHTQQRGHWGRRGGGLRLYKVEKKTFEKKLIKTKIDTKTRSILKIKEKPGQN